MMYPSRKAAPLQPRSFEVGPLRILSRLDPLPPLTFFTFNLVDCRTDSPPTLGQTSSQVSRCTYTDRNTPAAKHSTQQHSCFLRLLRLAVFQESISHPLPPATETCRAMRAQDLALPNGILQSIASSPFTSRWNCNSALRCS